MEEDGASDIPEAEMEEMRKVFEESNDAYIRRSVLRLPYEFRLEPCAQQLASMRMSMQIGLAAFLDCVTAPARGEGAMSHVFEFYPDDPDRSQQKLTEILASHAREHAKALVRMKEHTPSGREKVALAICSTLDTKLNVGLKSCWKFNLCQEHVAELHRCERIHSFRAETFRQCLDLFFRTEECYQLPRARALARLVRIRDLLRVHCVLSPEAQAELDEDFDQQ